MMLAHGIIIVHNNSTLIVGLLIILDCCWILSELFITVNNFQKNNVYSTYVHIFTI